MRPRRHAHRSPTPIAEPLERRQLLSVSPLAKIGTTLAADAGGAGTVAVEAYADPGRAAALVRAARRLGATGVAVHGRSVSADVPDAKLAALAALPSLRFARPDELVTHVGAVTTQADVSDRAANARSTYGLTGAGTTVGILSDSFNVAGGTDTYATDVASGDLPSGVTVLADGPAGSTDEGRAIAQVIADEAPGAKFAFATAEGGQATMAANIKNLVSVGAKVIVDDVDYLAEPMFQDGPIAQAVAAATAAGVSYFTSAGETDGHGYASSWRSSSLTLPAGGLSSAAGGPAFAGGTFFNFATDGTDQPVNRFTLAPGQSVTLSFQWDSPYYSVSGGSGCPNQVDAYVLDANNAVVGGGVNYDVGGDPVQVFTYTNTTSATATYGLSLVSESGAVPGYVKYVDFAGQATGWTYGYNSGTIYGHANAATAGAGLEAVGSASYAQTPAYGVTPPVVEPTSAAGTTPIFFDTSGNRLATPVVRQSPGIVAPDGGDTTFFGVQTNDGDSYPNFFGTSASAAAAAGVAALVLQAAPTATPAQVDAALQSTAIDMGTAGVDAQTGYGLIQADAAVAAAVNATTGTITGTVFLDANGNGTLDAGEAGLGGATAYVDTNNNGQRDGGEPSATVAANGTFTITGVTTGASKVVRVVAPNGYVATVAGRTVAATAGTTTANVALGLFPDAFFGTAGNDAYTLVLDATNKANLDVILAGGATLTAPRTLLPSIIFSPGLGNDALTVSFANGNPVPSGGLTYDGGAGTNTITVNGTAAADTATVFDQQTTFDNVSLLSTNISNETINGMGGTDTVGVTAALASGQTLTVNGGVGTTTFAVRATLPNNGAGYVFDAGTAAGDAGVLTVTVGPYALPAGDPAATSASLTLNANAATILPAAAAGTGVNARTFAAVNVGAGGTLTVAAPATHADRAVVVTPTLSVAAGGKVDLAGNDMVVQQGTLATLNALVATGCNAGLWTGKGIASSAAAADGAHLTAVGIMPNTAGGSTAAVYSAANPFDGIVPAANAVLLKSTYYGDANLDGVVNAADYARTDAGYLLGSTGWANGDFNYDGVVDGSDYTLIDNAFDQQTGGL